MAAEPTIESVLVQIAKELAAESGAPEAEVISEIGKWRIVLGRWLLTIPQLYQLVNSEHYWYRFPDGGQRVVIGR